MVTSFISAFFCVRWLLRYISTHSFVPFAWYRIAFGLIVLATWWTGAVNWSRLKNRSQTPWPEAQARASRTWSDGRQAGRGAKPSASC